jgi:beta-lactam-binding protein with PASTA domain
MGFFSFLLKKKFYLHLGYSIVLTVILFFAVLKFLNIYTHHGEAYIVPDFTHATMDEVLEQNFDEVFDFVLTDSVYNNNLRPGEIVLQNPSAGSKVKKDRNIYVTTVAVMPEMTIMPDLKDLTLRQALAQLRLNGLDINILRYKKHMAENAVIAQYHNEDTIPAGEEIIKGSKIDLVLGMGRNKPVMVPFLIGLSEKESHDAVFLSSFNLGKEYHLDDVEKEHSRVYRQEPTWDDDNKLYRGDRINLWFRSDLTFNFDSLIEVLRPDTTSVDSLEIEFPGGVQ